MKRLSLVATIKRFLTVGHGNERFELAARHEAPVRRALVRAALGANAREEMTGVLKLVVALETRLESTTAADRLRAWLRATPEIHDAIRALGFTGVKGLDFARAFKLREGRSLDLAAPQIDAAAPADSVPLHRLVERRRRHDPR
jgi:hypothetical protein